MNIRQARNKLKVMGFKFLPAGHLLSGNWGYMAAEPYDVGKYHFTPKYRDVFFAECHGGYYVTSHIKGRMRRYRCRYTFETDVGNIFGGGSTLAIAVHQFIRNFNTKTYNRS